MGNDFFLLYVTARGLLTSGIPSACIIAVLDTTAWTVEEMWASEFF